MKNKNEKIIIFAVILIFISALCYDLYSCYGKNSNKVENKKSAVEIIEKQMPSDDNLHSNEKNNTDENLKDKNQQKNNNNRQEKESHTNKQKNNIYKDKKKSNNFININKASVRELAENLEGIGETKAKCIVSYRQKNGNFSSIEEIKNVKGIGEKTFLKIKDKITV